MQTKTTKILPCPECNGMALVHQSDKWEGFFVPVPFWVQCEACGRKGKVALDDWKGAIENWNEECKH